MRHRIESPEEAEQAVEQIARLYRALADLRSNVAEKGPRQFTLLAEGPNDQIRELVAQLDEFSGVTELGPDTPSLWVRVDGAGITWPSAATSVITSVLDTVRKGLQAITEHAIRGALAMRPTSEIKEACDLRVVAFAPGSLRVGLRAPGGSDLAESVESSLDDYLGAASWAGSDEPETALEAFLPDRERRQIVLAQLRRLVPRQRGKIESVELSSPRFFRGAPAVLRRESRVRIDTGLERIEGAVVQETHDGVLREIDLDQLTFTLRNPGEVFETRCHFEEPLLESAKDALDKLVRISGVREVSTTARAQQPLEVRTIDILDSEGEE